MTNPLAFDVIIATLFTAFRRTLSEADLVLYERGCAGVPPPLLAAAVGRAVRTRRFQPNVAELLDDAEACRQEWLAEQAWAPCVQCEELNGWVSRPDDRGVERLARCACWAAHQARLAQAGLAKPLALPAPEPDHPDV